MKFMVLNFWVITYTFHSTNNSLSKYFVIFVNCNFLKEPLSRCFIYSISMHMHIVLYINQSNFVWFVEPVGIFIRTNKASPHQARHVYFSKVGSSSLVWDNSGISLNVEYSYILPIPFVISKTNVYLLKSNDHWNIQFRKVPCRIYRDQFMDNLLEANKCTAIFNVARWSTN